MGGSSERTVVEAQPTATQLAIEEAQLAAIQQQGAFQTQLFDQFNAGLSPEEQDLQDLVNQLTRSELERAIEFGPVQDQLTQLQLDAILNPGGTPEQLALIEDAIASSQIAGESEINRFTGDALEQIRDVLAPSRGLRPTDSPIIDRGQEIGQQGIQLKGDLTNKLAEVSANAKLNFPLAVSQFQAGAGNIAGQVGTAASQFQQQLAQSAFLNRLNVLNTTGNLGLGLANTGFSGFKPTSQTTNTSQGIGIGEVGQLLGGVGALAAFCWVAREVFGIDNPKWIQFRHYMLNKAPESFRDFYLENGEQIAKDIKDKPETKEEIRGLMETILSHAA